MARLNVSIPDDLYELANKWRSTVNLSEICARALRDELSAAETGKSIPDFFRQLSTPTSLEAELTRRYSLQAARVSEKPSRASELRDTIGREAAMLLEAQMYDRIHLAVCGGRQMWSVVRHLTPRAMSLSIEALGIGQHDPTVLHAHPNTLVTLLSLLYAPRSTARIITPTSAGTAHPESRPVTWLLSSCAPLDEAGPLAGLIGAEAVRTAIAAGACCDFAYQFLRPDGSTVSVSFPPDSRVYGADTIRRLAASDHDRVILVGGGEAKVEAMRLVLSRKLCNTLITDEETAQMLC